MGEDRDSRETKYMEIAATVLLSLATIATAWATFRSTLWGGEQTTAFSEASALRTEAVSKQDLADAQLEVDTTTFSQWVDSSAREDAESAEFWHQRFSRSLRPAFESWIVEAPVLEDAPLSLPPGTPFDSVAYQVEANEQGQQLELAADDRADEAAEANQTSDAFVLRAVLFATVLFFAGISTQFRARVNRVAIMTVGTAVFIATLVSMLMLPHAS